MNSAEVYAVSYQNMEHKHILVHIVKEVHSDDMEVCANKQMCTDIRACIRIDVCAKQHFGVIYFIMYMSPHVFMRPVNQNNQLYNFY